MSGIANLQQMSDSLRYYDVDQQGWEHEGLGFEFNAAHVLKHLAKDIIKKDFKDPDVVRSAIAPDAMQYALRLGRWTDQDPSDLLPTDDQIQELYRLAGRFGQMPTSQVAYLQAASSIGDNLHSLDHSKERHSALVQAPIMARSAGGLLIYCASQLSHEYGFSVDEAFDARLNDLRTRFNIAQPEA